MLVTMSDKELSRINVIQSVVEKRMRRRDAAHQLALTERQTQRLMNRFRESSAAGLSNLRRGRPGNHRLPESLKLRVLSVLHDHYSDFGPTLAAEKLRERHNITVSVETLRKWMTADGLWVPYSRRRPRVHQPRYRRDCLGELVQIDGSPHCSCTTLVVTAGTHPATHSFVINRFSFLLPYQLPVASDKNQAHRA